MFIEKREITWRKSIRCLLNIPSRTRSALIPGMVGTPPIFNIIHNRQINFISKCLLHNNNLVKFIFNNSITVIRNMNVILDCHDVLF